MNCVLARRGWVHSAGLKLKMSLCGAQAAAGKVFLDERTKLSAATLNKNNNVKREDDTRVTSLSFGISEAAGGLRNGKCNFSPRPRPLLCRISQLEVADLAPSTSAAYGILLLLGGLFACTLFFFFYLLFFFGCKLHTSLNIAAFKLRLIFSFCV